MKNRDKILEKHLKATIILGKQKPYHLKATGFIAMEPVDRLELPTC
jgi:hypothetical protein